MSATAVQAAVLAAFCFLVLRYSLADEMSVRGTGFLFLSMAASVAHNCFLVMLGAAVVRTFSPTVAILFGEEGRRRAGAALECTCHLGAGLAAAGVVAAAVVGQGPSAALFWMAVLTGLFLLAARFRKI